MSRTYSTRSLHGHVVHELGLRIVRGDYPSGSLPNEEELASHLEVSRTALREAVKVLTAKGLIESRPKVGTRVRPRLQWNMLDPDVLAWRCSTMKSDAFAQDLMEMREIVEPSAAALAARHRDTEQLSRIEMAYQEMADASDMEHWVTGDLHFHQAILMATGNELLTPLSSLIETALEALFVMSARNANDFKYSLPQHGEVLDAIRQQDENAARAAMQHLLGDSRANLTRRSIKTSE
ncbi:FadR/GntR family transcriptional regulator [Leeia sp.]|uniref:FadR/GntR family transcriptional regulator n=1 Tax=Leeia sp. TaxID=2884678 RepID=UPI0035B2CAC4